MMGAFEARLEREWERADEHAAGRHEKTYSDCAACQKDAREAVARLVGHGPSPEEPDGFVDHPADARWNQA